jgi:hypothetical protein
MMFGKLVHSHYISNRIEKEHEDIFPRGRQKGLSREHRVIFVGKMPVLNGTEVVQGKGKSALYREKDRNCH